MAEFSLNIKTECTQELMEIVSRINGAQPRKVGMPPELAAPYGKNQQAEIDAAELANALPTAEQLGAAEQAGAITAATTTGHIPSRDAHGIKRDDRIHANAADPFKADRTWKRRKNVPDEQYEEIYLELAREARAAGLYTGPAIPELELEDKVVDTEAPAPVAVGEALPVPEVEPVTPNPNAVVPTEAPGHVAPAPSAAPVATAPVAPAPGMSAEDTPTPVKAVQALVAAAGPMAAHSLFKAFGVTAAPDCTPQQLRDMVAIAEKLAATLPPAEKMTRGQEALASVALEFGYIVA